MTIELPDFVPPANKPALVRRDRTDLPDVYRHYDLEKAERLEPGTTKDAAPTPEGAEAALGRAEV